ncbi:MAG: 4Fe-4S binding protein, partial [bacterium]
MVKELVVISGKGGTGKTSIVASFAALAERAVMADCDVDAADLHLILEPTILRREKFSGGSQARIMSGHCIACGKCEEVCRFDAIFYDGPGNGEFEKTFRVDPIACEGCGVCSYFCSEKAIDFSPVINGEYYISDTRFGPMVHAKLGVAQENSGKLVSLVRTNAKQIAEERQLELILIDGSPGIGCPVIASLTG